MTESHIFIFENELIKFLSVGKGIKLNLDLSGVDSLLNRDSRHSQIYPSDETFFNYWSHLRYATHILSLPVGVCVSASSRAGATYVFGIRKFFSTSA